VTCVAFTRPTQQALWTPLGSDAPYILEHCSQIATITIRDRSAASQHPRHDMTPTIASKYSLLDMFRSELGLLSVPTLEISSLFRH
jgi:hypothetical protein